MERVLGFTEECTIKIIVFVSRRNINISWSVVINFHTITCLILILVIITEKKLFVSHELSKMLVTLSNGVTKSKRYTHELYVLFVLSITNFTQNTEQIYIFFPFPEFEINRIPRNVRIKGK